MSINAAKLNKSNHLPKAARWYRKKAPVIPEPFQFVEKPYYQAVQKAPDTRRTREPSSDAYGKVR
ncbi:MAG: hypothetical protein E6X17_15445, partial [Sporomusaceae bacterium]|nr:hypothetical protein [Sporomusaceae bacterium]